MKRKINFAVAGRTVCGILIAAIVFSACKKDRVDVPASPVSGVMAFNLIPDKAIGFTLSGNNLTGALNYTNFTGTYLPVYTGPREVRSFDAANGNTLATGNAVFADSMYYSIFAIGVNGNYRNVITPDRLDTLSVAPGQAFVRYINAVTDTTANPVVTISSGGTTYVNTAAAYGTVSGFAKVPVGTISIAAAYGTEFAANRTITVETNKIYTVLLVGTPGSTNPDNAVQVKFITNGIVN